MSRRRDAGTAPTGAPPQLGRLHGRPTDRSPCPGLWKTPVIRWDGELAVCCADVAGEIRVGNLRDATFAELWFGETMNRYRLWHVEGRFEEMPRCQACGGINFYKMGPEEVRAWLDEVGRLDAWPAYAARMGLEP